VVKARVGKVTVNFSNQNGTEVFYIKTEMEEI
jgi:hypothetical protein